MSYANRRNKFVPVKSLDSSEFSSELSDLRTAWWGFSWEEGKREKGRKRVCERERKREREKGRDGEREREREKEREKE